MMRKIVKGASLALLARIVFTATSFAVTSLTAWVYGATTVGMVASLTAVVTMGGIVANLGTSSSLTYHIGTQLETASLRSAKRSYHRIVVICLCGCAIVALGLMALAAPIEAVFSGAMDTAPWLLLAIAVIGVPLRLFSELTGTALRAFEDIAGFAVLIVLPPILTLALLGLGIWAGAGPMTAIWALLGGYGLSAAIGFVWIERRLHSLSDDTPEAPSPGMPQIITHAFPMLISTLGAYVVTSIGLLLTPLLADHAATGQFAVALRLATTTSLVLMSINAMTTPIFARLHASGDQRAVVATAQRTSRLMFWAVVPMAVGLIAFGRPLIALAFGPDFAPAYTPMVIMLLGQLVNTITGPSDFLMNMAQMQKALRSIILPVAVFTTASSAVLIPMLGITGAALSYAISLTVWNLASAIYLRRRYGAWIAYLPGLTRTPAR